MKKQSHLWIIAVVILLSGCSVPSSGEGGRCLDAALLRGIIPDQTGKDELYISCGWPSAVMLQDDTVLFGIVPREKRAPLHRRLYRVDAAAYFELFARRRTLLEAHQIVCYEHLMNEFEGATADRLWVLVNEATGLVEDYAFKKHGEPTFFAGDALLEAP